MTEFAGAITIAGAYCDEGGAEDRIGSGVQVFGIGTERLHACTPERRNNEE